MTVPSLQPYYCDLHVHIGRSSAGRPVKVTASRELTLEGIVHECLARKGIGLVAVVDGASPEVQRDVEQLLQQDVLSEQPGGGLRYGRDGVGLLLAAEVELGCPGPGGGAFHLLVYLRDLEHAGRFSRDLAPYVTNPELSTQRVRLAPRDLVRLALETGPSVVVLAHAFTPHKGFFGACAARLEPAFGELSEAILAVELGLSADTAMADRLAELAGKTFLTSSDAHSLRKIGREHTEMLLAAPSFEEFARAVRQEGGRKVLANYGLSPRLGKYHRTACESCGHIATAPPPVTDCPACGSSKVTLGVLDRIAQIADRDRPLHPQHRPPYRVQVPLEFVPGIGPRALERLIERFGSEMAVLHQASFPELTEVVGTERAERIIAAREGRLTIEAGGGGRYGRVGGHTSRG